MLSGMNTTTDPTVHRRAIDRACTPHPDRRLRWLTVLTAMAAATALGGLLDPVLGVDLAVQQGDDVVRVENLAITLSSLAAGLLGWGLLELLERRSSRARRTWTVWAAVVFAVSLLGPLGAETAGAAAGLVSLHALVAGILVVGLRRTATDT